MNLLQQAQILKDQIAIAAPAQDSIASGFELMRRREQSRPVRPRLRPPLLPLLFNPMASALESAPNVQSLSVNPVSPAFGFAGLTHADQRNANGGNQFSIEPPTPAIAAGEGFVMEGVNNAVQVYNTSGVALLPMAVSSNQLFGVAPAIDRATGVNGIYPTDMRVFYDADIRRWVVLQWAQLNDAQGNPLDQSREWMAVSQTSDPTGTYNIYMRDTTNAKQAGCPCVPDYPLLGADEFGLFISSNQFNTGTSRFANLATILVLSKVSLASGAFSPTAVEITIPFTTGYEFSIHPATIPPGARSLAASNGAEYFVSSISSFSIGNNLTVWVATNTSSLLTANPVLTLSRTTVPTQTYSFPPEGATQRSGILPYGSSLTPPGLLPRLDGGDTRLLSVSYVGGRIYATLATEVIDEGNRRVVGGAYFILSRKLRGGLLAVEVARQGYLMVNNNHLLRSALAVNAQGRGAVAFTLMGPDYYPSTAYIPIDMFTTGSTVQIVGAGSLPEDGFTGYPNSGSTQQGIARWGDNSAAVADTDGSIWFTSEYIPNGQRTQLANWGTFVGQHRP